MWKIQLFVFVEALLLTMAAITILAGNISRIVLIVVLCLLLLYYYIGKQRSNFLLVASSILAVFYCHVKSLCHRCAFVCCCLCHAGGLSLFFTVKTKK